MSKFDRTIVARKTLADLCDARNTAIHAFTDARRLLERAAADLSVVGDFLWPYDSEPRKTVEAFTQELDARMWRFAWDKTDLPKVMDAKARDEFDTTLNHNAPAFTLENVRSAMVSAASQADEMFARGLYEMFRTRDMALKTNARERVKIPRKLIWTGSYVDSWGSGPLRFTYSTWHADRLGDLDRVFKTLAGMPYHPRELVTALNQAWAQGTNLYEDSFYRIRGFLNGNLHIELRQQTLIDKANHILANYAGPVLPQAAAA